MWRDIPAAHRGGFAVAQWFPQPLVNGDVCVQRKELFAGVELSDLELQSKGYTIW
jgi:hypothetical protein